MSSNNSRDFYHNSGARGRSSGQSLPPLRSVLGDQLALPVTSGHAAPYDLDEIYNALPPSSRGTQDNQSSARPSSRMSMSYAKSRGSDYETSQAQQSYAYSSASASHHALTGRHARPMTPTHDTFHQSSSSSSSAYTSFAPKGSDRGTYKKYACTWDGCDKRFERQTALDTHMNIHLEQKPFACPVPNCGKVFNVRSNMRRHLLTHKDVQAGSSDSWSPVEEDGEDYYAPEGDSGYFHHSSHAQHTPSTSERRHSSSASRHHPSQYYSSSRRT